MSGYTNELANDGAAIAVNCIDLLSNKFGNLGFIHQFNASLVNGVFHTPYECKAALAWMIVRLVQNVLYVIDHDPSIELRLIQENDTA